MLFDILVIISVICFIPLAGRLANLFPSLAACLLRWKENINLQASLKMRTDRDILALALFVPFCLCIFRYRVYCPEFMQVLSENTRLWATLGIFSAYVLLRIACRIVFRMHNTSGTVYKQATDSVRTFFIILVILLLIAIGILSFFETPLSHVRTAMFWISGFIYIMFLFRKTQIFLSSCNFFASFLYLCALEILPTGVLIASAVIF